MVPSRELENINYILSSLVLNSFPQLRERKIIFILISMGFDSDAINEVQSGSYFILSSTVSGLDGDTIP